MPTYQHTISLEQCSADRFFLKKHLLGLDHDGGYIVVFNCFAASGPKKLAIIVGTTNWKLYQDILQENIKVAVHHLKLNKSWMMQQDSDTNPTTECFENKKMHVLNWLIRSPDLWHDLKRTIYTRNPRYIAELKQIYKEESFLTACRSD